MAKSIKVLVNTGNEETNKTFDVASGSGKAGKPTTLKAVKGARYHLEDPAAKNVGPENIRSKRVGKNLHVMLDGSKDADLIIEGYYDDAMLTENNRGLYGRAEDGKLYEYIPEDPTPSGLPINLADGGKPVSQVLGGGQVGEEFALSGLILAAAGGGFSALTAGAAAVGAAALAGGGGGGGGGTSGGAVIPTAPAAAPASYADNVGSKQSTTSTDAKTDDTTPGLNIGQVPSGATPKLYVDGVYVPATYDSVTGTLTPNTPLSEGAHSITYTLSNSAGESAKSPAMALTVDTTAPTTTAAVTEITDNVGPTQGAVANGGVTDDTNLTLKGTLTAPLAAGETIRIYDGSTFLGTATVGANNTWTFTDTRTLANGAAVSYTARVADEALNQSAAGTPFTATVDTSVPTISITSVAGDTVADSGNGTFDATERGANATTVTTKPVISGTSTFASGLTAKITLNIAGVDETASTTINTNGTWSVELTDAQAVKLNHGNTYTIVASVTNSASTTAIDSNNGVLINTAQPDIPTVLNNYASTFTPTLTGLAMKEDPSAQGTFIALQTGDTMSVTVGGATYNVTLGSLPNGFTYDGTTHKWSLNTAAATASSGTLALVSGNTYNVGVSVTSGISTANPSGVTKTDVSTGELVINTTAPTITLDPISDGYINASEKASDLVITGTTDAQVGSKVTITGLDGTARTATVIAGNNGANTFALIVTGTEVAGFTGTDTTKTVHADVLNAFNLHGTADKAVVIDTLAPITTVTIDSISDDTGVSAADFITSDNNGLTIRATLGAALATDEKLWYSKDNGTTWTDITSSVNSTAVTHADSTLTASNTIQMRVGDAAKNYAAAASKYIVIDASGSTNPDNGTSGGTTPDANTTAAVTIDAISTDTGVSSSDFITSDNSLIYSGSVTGFANNGDVVKVQITPAGGATVTAYATVTMTGANTGTWVLDKSAITLANPALADGNYTVVATLADKAGNQVGTSQATQIVTIDNSGSTNTDHGNGSGTPTTDGNATSATASIDSISTDSGFSATDFITNDATLLIKGVASISSAGVAAGDQLLVEIKDNNSVVVATQYVKPDASGNWQLNNQANTLADGKYTIAVHVVDLAGNKVKADADTQVLIVDTNQGGTNAGSNPGNTDSNGAAQVDPNAATGVSVAITGITDDTGFSASDFITADGTLSISGTTNGFTNAVGTGSAGDKVRVQIVDSANKVVAQTYVDSNGTWSFNNQANTLSDGSYTLQAAIVDAADNIVKAGTPQALVISSTAAPTNATLAISAISDDTGTSTVDFITQDRTLTINGTVNNFDSSAHKLLVQVINSANTVVTSEANVTVTNGTWTLNNGALNNGSLADGKYTIRAVLTSSAGVEIASTVTTHGLAIDNAGGTNPDNGSGGSNPTDANTTAALSITTIHDVAHGSVDSGASTSDFITNDATLIVQGSVTGFSNTGASAGDKVRVQIVDSTNTVVAQQYVTPDANGAWSFDNTNNTLKDGKYNVKAVIVDAPGNTVNTEVTHSLVIDTNDGGKNNGSNPGNTDSNGAAQVDPNAASGVSVAVTGITTDSGYSATDYITADGTLTISGTTTGFTNATGTGSAGDKVRVQILNAQGDVVAETYTDPVSGAWSFNNQANTLFDGNYTLKAAIVDAAGNVVKAGADQALVIDNGNTPTNATLAISSISDDSGVSASDFVTNDNTLTITGTTAGFNTSGTDKILVQVLNGTTVVTSGYATAGVNTWSYNAAALSDGNYTVRAVYTTATGTEISPPQTHSLVVDSAAGTNPENGSGSNATDPNAGSTVTVSIAGITDDTGVSATDLITTDQTLVISGNTANFTNANGGAGDVVRVQIINTVGTAGNRTAYVNVDANGNWSLDNVANTLSAGTYTLKADIVDKAGNTVKLGTDRTLTVQTAVDPNNNSNSTAAVLVTVITDDTGASSTDYITSDNVLTFSGTVSGYTANGANSDKVKVELLAANGTTVIATAYVDVTVTTGTNATWAWPYQTLQADGNYSVRATLVNTAGIAVNTGVTGTNTHAFTIDSHGGTNVDPNGGGTPTTDANTTATVAITNISDDTGPGANDFVTKDTTLTYSGTVAGFTANGDKVKLELLAADGTTVVATAYVDTSVTGTGAQNGTWTWAYQTNQDTGKYTIRATIVDVPGNRVNAAAGGQATQIIVVDNSGSTNPDNGQGSGSGGNNGGGTDTNTSATATITTIHDVANGSVDSGADSTDFVTNDNTLVVKGTVAGFTSTGATKGDQLLVTILSGSTVVATQYVMPDSAGNWVMNNQVNRLADGAYTINVDIVDLAGGTVKAAAATHSLVIDTNDGGTNNGSNPGNSGAGSTTDTNAGNTVTVAVSAITDDTGFSTADYITADHSLVISGTTANFSNTAGSTGDTVRVQVLDSTGKVVAEKYVTPTANAWSADITDTNLPDGSYSIRNAIVDKAGNIVKAGTDQPLVISSTAALTSATVSIASISDDTGYDVTDFITKDNTLTINGATNGYNSSTDKVLVQVLNGSTVVAQGFVTPDGAGKWSFLPSTGTNSTVAASLADGSYTVRAVLTNTAGVEVTGTAATHALVVDNASGTNYGGSNGTNGSGATDANSGSGVSVTTIHNPTNGSTDSGSNSTDFITNDNTLVIKGNTTGFSATGPGALDKVRVQILDSNNVVVAQQYVTPDTAGNWAIDNKANALKDGKYSIKADIVDAADNLVKAGTAQALVIDTNQGGTDNSSNPGNGSGANGTDANAASGTISIGSITTDTGFSATDFITADGTLVISGTSSFVNTGGAAGDQVRVQIVNAQGNVVGETYVNSTGAWSFDNQANTLVDGNYTLKAAIVDAAGNVVKAAADQALVINSGHTPTTATLAISSISTDSGTSATDFVTNDNTLTITGTTDGFAVNGTDKIWVQVIKTSDGSVASSGYATHSTATSNAGWTFVTDGGVNNTVSATTLANGTYTIRAVYTTNTGTEISTPVTHSLVVDNAGGTNFGGNNSNGGSGSGTVDPNANVALSTDSITEDTGVSATDWVTADNQLVINGSAPGFTALNGGEGDVVRVQILNGATLVRESFVTVDATGHWALDNTANTLADGTYTVKAAILDAAGNSVKTAADKALTIHTGSSNQTDPNTSASVAITAISDDTGTVGDFNTSDTTLTYSGTVSNFTNNGDLVKLVLTNSRGDVVATQYATPTSGTWTWAYPTAQSDGNYTLTATLVDTAGSRLNNAAGGQATQLVVIDTTAPTTTAAVTAINDNEGLVTGVVATGGTTDDTTPGVSGTLSAALATGETVRVYNGATYVGDATVNGTTWSFTDNVTNPASGTTVSYTARVADKALNQSAAGTAYTATINTSVPTLTISSIAGDAVADAGNGTYSALERGNTAGTTIAGTRPVISGTSVNVEQGSTVNVVINIAGVDKTYTAIVGANGAWTTTALSDADAVALNHGNTYAITASVSNTAGKQAIDHNNGMLIDIAAPDIPTVVNTFAGTTTPTLTGAAQKAVPGTPVTYIALATGDTLTVTVGGATYSGTVGSLPAGMTYDANTHTWSVNTASVTPTSGTLMLASGNTYDVGVTVSAGGVSQHDVSAGELVINTTAPTITLDAISGGYINAVETVQALTLTGTTTAQVGATVSVTGLDNTTYFGTAVAGASGQPNTFVITVPAANVTAFSVDGSTLHATAHVTNLFHLSGSAAQDVVVDTTGPSFSSAAAAAAVTENTANTTVLYTAAATDAHGVTYSLKGTGDDSLFNIDSTSGAVKLNTAANYEGKASYAFTVVATDAAGNTTDKPVTLAVTNVDEVAPTITSGATATVVENTAATAVVYTATATDTDYAPQGALSISYSLTGTDAGLLTINNSTGAVTLNAASDYETKTSYSFNVVATDAKGNAGSQAVTLNVTNVDEVAPTFSSAITATAVNENIAANTAVYTAAATDTDFNSPATANSVTYSLKANTGDVGKFSINSSTGVVTLTESPNFEVKNSYAFTVIATDAAGNAREQAVTLGVTNVNEAPTGANATITVLEDGSTTFAATDFGFTDAADAPNANALSAVIITTLPAAGTLKLNGVDVTLNQSISAADIAAGKLVYAPAANANGAGYASIGFKVQDNGGITNGGVDTSASANTLTFNVTAVNDAPTGTNATITVLEDGSKTFAASDFGFADASDGTAPNALSAVIITTLPAAGTLKLNGVDVTLNQSISAADIAASKLVYAPAANANGTGYASIGFKVQDNGGITNGGVDTSTTANTLTFTVTAVNDAPVLNTSTVLTMAAINEDAAVPTGTAGTLVSSLFGAITDVDAGASQGLAITGVNGNGTLYFSTDAGTTWTAATGTLSDTNALLLSGANRVYFKPNADWNGTIDNAFLYRAWDQTNGATAGTQVSITGTGGIGGSAAYSSNFSKVGITVNAVNDAPVIVTTANPITTLEDTATTFVISTQLAGKVTDVDGTALKGIVIVQNLNTTGGTWAYSTDGTTWVDFPTTYLGTIDWTKVMYLNASDSLRFTPAANANTNGLAANLLPDLNFRAVDATFPNTTSGTQVNINTSIGGTGPVSNQAGHFTVSVTAVNDAPTGTNATITLAEDGSKTFAAADFGFADAADTPANTLSAVIITTLPTAGTLKLNGTDVTLNQSISAADITAGKLVFAPAANANGTGYASIGFKLQDNGGTANGGVDTSTTANTLTFNVTAVNDAPIGVADTATIGEAGGALNATAGAALTSTTPGVTALNVISNDTDVDNATNTLTVKDILKGTTGTATAVTASTTSANGQSVAGVYGTLVIGADGSYTYSVDQANATVQALNVGGTVNDVFTYTVKDPGGLTSTATLTITVNGANDAPIVANLIADTTGTEGTALSYVVPANAFSDVDNATLTYTYSVVDGSGVALSTQPTWLSFDASTRTFTGTPPVGTAGTVHVKVTASDGSLTANDTFDIVVTSPDNIAPTLLSTSPADNGSVTGDATGLASNLTLTFSEAVKAGTGLIELYNASGTLVESFNAATGVGSAGGVVTGWNTSTLTLNPFASLTAGTGYYVKVAATAVKDLAGNAYAGITDATTFNFVTLNADGSVPVIPPYAGQAASQLGFSVSSAGDVNGDGYDDVIVSAPGSNSYAGAAYVIYGNAAGAGVSLVNGTIAPSLGFKIGGASSSTFGYSVSAAGDVNGDGFADVIVGATGGNMAYVVYGSASAPSAAALDFSTTTLASSNGFSIKGVTAVPTNFGSSVSSAGDVNGDGLADLMVGAPGTSNASYIIYGKTNAANLDLSAGTIAPSDGYKITGIANTYFGLRTSNAGDVNGDGLADQIIGAYNQSSAAGAAYIIYGNSTGTGFDANGVMNASTGYIITGGGGNYLGESVSSAGDVNGDGLADVIVGGEGMNAAYVVYGNASRTSLDLSGGNIAPSNGYKIIGQSGTAFGYSVSSAGDVNGDGLGDVIVGAISAGTGGTAGAAYVVYGNATGATVDISTGAIAASNGFRLATTLTAGRFGYFVSNAGDINGDGLSDLIIGAPTTNTSAGAYYIVLGGTQTMTSAVNLTGTAADEAVLGTAGNDTLVGGGGVDRFFAGKGNDTIVLQASDVTNLSAAAGTTRETIQGGEGFDTLQVSAASVNLDLTAISNAGAMGFEENSRIESIERINLGADATANTLTLTATDVKDMAGFNNIHTTTASADGKTWTNVGAGTALSATTQFHQVVVDGTSADSLTLEVGNGYWTNVGEVNYTGNTGTGYYVYQNTATNSQVIVDKSVVVNNKDSGPVGGDKPIDLGTFGKLIAPVQVEGKWYYYWDRSGDGTSANTGSLNGSTDTVTHDTLDTIFKYDINGNLNPNAGTNTDSVYRYATINGVQLALPTSNGDITHVTNPAGTSATGGGTTNNSVYDEMLAIWDNFNGTSTSTLISGAPTGWANAVYNTATLVSSTAHEVIGMPDGSTNPVGWPDNGVAPYTGAYAALQVVAANAAPVLDAAQTPTLTSLSASAAAPVNGNTTAGDLVSSLVGGISDTDAGALKGIAITGVHTGGTLYYSLDGGATWLTPATTLSDTNALLLAADTNTRVFYKANGTSGTIADAITFRGWDETQHITEGVFTSTVANGGKSEFSTATDTVGVFASLPTGATLDLGTVSGIRLNLIQKVTAANGKVYYHVDLNGSNTVDGPDYTDHNALDTLFNGGADTTGATNPTAGQDTERSVIVNGYTLVLPTRAEFLASLSTTTAWGTAYGWLGTNFNYMTADLASAGYHYDANYSATNSRPDTWSNGFAVEVKVPVAPVVLDLNRDGTFSYSQVAMDVNGSNHLSLTQWAGAQDGVLVWDKLGDGVVHDNSQYAFGQYATSTRFDAAGYNRLASDLDGLSDAFDTNHDGVFNAADAKFAEFKVWQDVNQNGVSDAGEVRSLADWGITSINLVSDGVQRTPVAGVTEVGQSTAALADGSSMQVADALFAYNALDYSVTGNAMNLLGADMHLDLSSVVAVHSNVTAMDLTGTGANTVKLSLADVLSVATDASIANGVHKLTLTGDANDTVELDLSQWANTGTTVTEGDHTYAVYNASSAAAAQLLIDQHMVLANHG